MTKHILTQEEVKSKFIYSADTGLFHSITLTRQVGHINKNGYIRLKINRIEYKAHRLAWLYVTGEMPDLCIDHINGIKNDNRFVNLRLATLSENNYNSGLKPNNTSGFKGISLNKNTGKWIAQASINNKNKYLGSFNTPEEASKSYNNFIAILHREFFKQTVILN